MHVDTPQSFCENVLLTDQLKIELIISHQLYVHRQKNIKCKKEKHTIPTVYHGGGLVMFWGYFGASGIIYLDSLQGTIKSQDYRTLE